MFCYSFNNKTSSALFEWIFKLLNIAFSPSTPIYIQCILYMCNVSIYLWYSLLCTTKLRELLTIGRKQNAHKHICLNFKSLAVDVLKWITIAQYSEKAHCWTAIHYTMACILCFPLCMHVIFIQNNHLPPSPLHFCTNYTHLFYLTHPHSLNLTFSWCFAAWCVKNIRLHINIDILWTCALWKTIKLCCRVVVTWCLNIFFYRRRRFDDLTVQVTQFHPSNKQKSTQTDTDIDMSSFI